MRKIQIFFVLFCIVGIVGCKQTNLQKANRLYAKRDFKEALFHYEQACLEGEIYACKMVATLYQEGKHHLPLSKAKALKALETACSYGDLPSCKITYKAYNLLKLQDLANKVLQYSCRGGEVSSCLQLAQTLYSPKNYKDSLELSTKACYGGNIQGCKLAIAITQRFNPPTSNLKGLEKQLKLLLQS